MVLATCLDTKYRKPAQAVNLAKKATQVAPTNGDYWNTLGVAHYRAGRWQEAIAALENTHTYRKGRDGSDYFFLAMAYWQLSEKEEARAGYDRAVAWMDKNKPQDELRRFRDEATALLGLAKAAPTPQKKPDSK